MLRSLLASPSAISTGIQGLGLAVRLLFMLVLVHRGSPEVLGLFGLLTAIDTITIYAAGFELHTFSTRRYARHPLPSQLRISFAVHTRVFRFTTPLAAIIAVATAEIFGIPLDTWGVVSVACISATGVIAQETGRYLVLVAKPIRAMTQSFLRTAGWMPVAALFVGPVDGTVRAIVISWAAASLVATLWGLHALRAALSRRLRMRTRYVMRALARSCRYYVVATASQVQANIERFVLQVMLGPAAVGIYALFATLANTLSALIQAGVLNIFLPRLLTAFGGLTADRKAVLRLAMKRALLVCILMAAFIVVAAVPIVHFTRHAEYLQYLWILPALLIGQTFLMWTQPVHLALYGAHHDRLLLVLSLVFLAASLGLSAFFIGVAGIAGAAAAPVVANLALAYTRWRLFVRLEQLGKA